MAPGGHHISHLILVWREGVAIPTPPERLTRSTRMVRQGRVLLDPLPNIWVTLHRRTGRVLLYHDPTHMSNLPRTPERLNGDFQVGRCKEPVRAYDRSDRSIGTVDSDITAGLSCQNNGTDRHVVVGWLRGGR